ncbi:uncharacterized protein N7483_004735 [Penicillium malachiteum]|uniref:uncharacterized protein n=1 Tax=Penicillium malachiteum TaxID=1324776 RepID=UPI0025481316|nr:uncharacterized protein N7483_004735 [Penicillium malachiteum]KAJ5730227.1 hypothetical protein N7483_004735 [Penicillium malachiteum]
MASAKQEAGKPESAMLFPNCLIDISGSSIAPVLAKSLVVIAKWDTTQRKFWVPDSSPVCPAGWDYTAQFSG